MPSTSTVKLSAAAFSDGEIKDDMSPAEVQKICKKYFFVCKRE